MNNSSTHNTVTRIEVLSVSSTQIILCWGYGKHSSSSLSVSSFSPSTTVANDRQKGTSHTWSKLPLPLQQRLRRRHQELEILAQQRRNNTNGGGSSSTGLSRFTAASSSSGASYVFTTLPSLIDRWHIQYSPRYLGRWLEWDSYLRIPFVILNGLEANCRYIFRLRHHHRYHGWSPWIYTNNDIVTLPTVPLNDTFLSSLSSLIHQSGILAFVSSSLSYGGIEGLQDTPRSLPHFFLPFLGNSSSSSSSSSATVDTNVNPAVRTLFRILRTVWIDGYLQRSNILRYVPSFVSYFHDSVLVLALLLTSTSFACPLISTDSIYSLLPLYRHSSKYFPNPVFPSTAVSSSFGGNGNTTMSSSTPTPSRPSTRNPYFSTNNSNYGHTNDTNNYSGQGSPLTGISRENSVRITTTPNTGNTDTRNTEHDRETENSLPDDDTTVPVSTNTSTETNTYTPPSVPLTASSSSPILPVPIILPSQPIDTTSMPIHHYAHSTTISNNAMTTPSSLSDNNSSAAPTTTNGGGEGTITTKSRLQRSRSPSPTRPPLNSHNTNGIRYIGRYGAAYGRSSSKVVPSNTVGSVIPLSSSSSSSLLSSSSSSFVTNSVFSSASYVPPTEMYLQNGVAIACQRCTRPLRNLMNMLNGTTTTSSSTTGRTENESLHNDASGSQSLSSFTNGSSGGGGGRIRICSLCCRQLCIYCRCHTVYDGCVENYGELFVQRVCLDCAIETSLRFTNQSRTLLSSSSLASVSPSTPDTLFSSSSSSLPSLPDYTGGLVILPHADLDTGHNGSTTTTYPTSTTTLRPTNNGLQILSSGAALALLMAIGKDAEINLEMAIYKWSQPHQWTPGRIFKAIQEQVQNCQSYVNQHPQDHNSSTQDGFTVVPYEALSPPRKRTGTTDTGRLSPGPGPTAIPTNTTATTVRTIDQEGSSLPLTVDTIPSVSSSSTALLSANDLSTTTPNDGSTFIPSFNNDIVILSSPTTSTLSSVRSPSVPPPSLQKSNSAFHIDEEEETNTGTSLLRTPIRTSVMTTDRSIDSVSSALTRHTITPSLHSVYMMSPSQRRSAFVSSFLPSTVSSISSALSTLAATDTTLPSPVPNHRTLLPLLSSSVVTSNSTKLLRAKVYTDGRVHLPENHPATKLRNQLRHTSTLLEYITLLYTHRGAVTNLRITKVIAANHLARMKTKMVKNNNNNDNNNGGTVNNGTTNHPPSSSASLFDPAIHPSVKTLLVVRSHVPLVSLTKQARLDLTREPGIVISAPSVPYYSTTNTYDKSSTDSSTESKRTNGNGWTEESTSASTPLLYPQGKLLSLGDAPWAAVLKLKGKLSGMSVVDSAVAGIIPGVSTTVPSASSSSVLSSATLSSSSSLSETMESRYVGLGTNDTYTHMEKLIRQHVQQCIRYLNHAIIQALETPSILKDQLRTFYPTLPIDLIDRTVESFTRLYYEEEEKLIEAFATALVICCSRTHSGGDAHAIAHDVYGGPSPMHTEPGHPIPRQLVLLRHAQPARWPALGLAKNVIASCPPLHIIFPSLDYTDSVSTETSRRTTKKEDDDDNARNAIGSTGVPSSASVPVRVRTCDIYQVADYADLEGSTWAFLATTMMHDLRVIDSNEYHRYFSTTSTTLVSSFSSSISSSSSSSWEGGFRTPDQWSIFLRAFGKRVHDYYQTPPEKESISSSIPSNESSVVISLDTILRTVIQSKLPLLIDTERALSITPIGREPGEVRICLLGVQGLGTVAPGTVDEEEEEANDVAERLNGKEKNPSKGGKKSTFSSSSSSSSVLEKLGLVRPSTPSTLALAIQRALLKKGLRTDAQRMSLALSVVANTNGSNSNSSTNTTFQVTTSNDSTNTTPTPTSSTMTLAQATETALREALGLGPSVFLPYTSNSTNIGGLANTPLSNHGSTTNNGTGSSSSSSTGNDDLLPQEHPGSVIPLLDTASLTYVRRYGVPSSISSASSSSSSGKSSSSSSITTGESSFSTVNNDTPLSTVPVLSSSSSVSTAATVPSSSSLTTGTSKTPSAYVVLRCGTIEIETPSKPILDPNSSSNSNNNNASVGKTTKNNTKTSSLSSSSSSSSSNRRGSLPSGTNNTSIRKGNHPGYMINGWKESIVLPWDGTTAITLSLWSIPAAYQHMISSSFSSSSSTSSSLHPSTTISNASHRISTSLGTAAFSLMGLYPGLPERISVPLVTRIMVKVTVEHNEQGSCVCHENYRKLKGFTTKVVTKNTYTETGGSNRNGSGNEDEGGNESTPTYRNDTDDNDDEEDAGEGMEEEEVDRFATNSTLYRSKPPLSSTGMRKTHDDSEDTNEAVGREHPPWLPYHPPDDDQDDEYDSSTGTHGTSSKKILSLTKKKIFLPSRSSFALTGQLSVIAPSPSSSSSYRGKRNPTTTVKELTKTEKEALAKTIEEEERQRYEWNHTIEECVDIETGRLLLEVYYWPYPTVLLAPNHSSNSTKIKKTKEKSFTGTTNTLKSSSNGSTE